MTEFITEVARERYGASSYEEIISIEEIEPSETVTSTSIEPFRPYPVPVYVPSLKLPDAVSSFVLGVSLPAEDVPD